MYEQSVAPEVDVQSLLAALITQHDDKDGKTPSWCQQVSIIILNNVPPITTRRFNYTSVNDQQDDPKSVPAKCLHSLWSHVQPHVTDKKNKKVKKTSTRRHLIILLTVP